jgi:diaminohydroxyphosphoribosylaminopyrimidine deaminase / 5-amino-6-(5-phosphoribosylamino)uracil reductase
LSERAPVDHRWLDAAVRLAQPWLGTTAESPTVSALIVAEDLQLVFGRAVTGRGGRPSAETLVLGEASSSARGRTLYITLEPSIHRQPSAVEAIVDAGVARVVIGVADPEPRGAGEGLRRLRAAGIEVVVAGHEPSRRLHEPYVSRIIGGRPLVTARLAVSRDGMIGVPDAGRVPMGEEATRWSQMLRAVADAVVIGARTAERDDPPLTVDLEGLEHRSHLRVVVVGARDLPPELSLIRSVSGYPTAIIAESGRQFDVPATIEVISVDGRSGRPDLRKSLAELARRGISHVLAEGGARLTESLLAAELVDYFHLIECDAQLGRKGVPATALGGIDGRLRGAGFIEVDRRRLGADNLRTFEKEF